MRKKRFVVADPEVSGTFHITNRCIRRAFLMADGKPTRGPFRNRRHVVLNRLKNLAAAYSIDILRVALMSTHIHLLIRNRPDLVKLMSDEEVARRYFQIHPGYCQATADARGKKPDQPTQEDIEKLAQDKQKIAKIRRMLSSISHFMKSFNFYVSRYFNLVDGTTGAFWESRYKLKALLDDLSILLCAFYIDLNPIRARMSKTLETSDFTSIFYQIVAARMLAEQPQYPEEKLPTSFLTPVTISPNEADKIKRSLKTRASDFGFTYLSSQEYLIAADLMGRILSKNHDGVIPSSVPPIFERLNLNWESIFHLVDAYEELFSFYVGSKASLEKKASDLGGRKLKCPAMDQGLLP